MTSLTEWSQMRIERFKVRWLFVIIPALLYEKGRVMGVSPCQVKRFREKEGLTAARREKA